MPVILGNLCQAALDFDLICKRENLRDEFEESFPQWARAVVKYCKDTQVKSTALQAETEEFHEDISDGMFSKCTMHPCSLLGFLTDKCALMALRCMAIMFTPMELKKMGDSIPFVLQVVPVS